MKLKLIIIAIAFILCASFAFADGAVQITPDPAYDSDMLFCKISANGNAFTYTWSKNGQNTAINGAYVLPVYTNAGDSWKCTVKSFIPSLNSWVELGKDTITINPDPLSNTAPVVNIISPENRAVFYFNNNIRFEGTALDNEDGELTGNSLKWRSNINGEFGSGKVVNFNGLSIGEHIITLEATDSMGAKGSKTIRVFVLGNDPVVTITNPADNSVFTEGQMITFQATATDTEDGNLNSQIRWRTNLDSFDFGTGSTVTINSSLLERNDEDTFQISARVTDSDEQQDTDVITITINPANNTNDTNQTNTTSNITVTLIADPNSGTAPLTVNFICSVKNGTAPYSYGWAVSNESIISDDSTIYSGGALSNSKSKAFSVTIEEPGTWYAACAVVDSLDREASEMITIEVSPGNNSNGTNNTNQTNQTNISATLTANPTEGYAPLPVNFTCTIENGTAPYSYDIVSSNGQTILTGGILSNSNSVKFNTTLSESGVWNASCSVRDSLNRIASHIITLNVYDNQTNNTNNTNNTNQTGTAPSIDLIYPIDSVHFNNDANVHFLAQATDAEEGTLTGNHIEWYSSRDGFLNYGTEFYRTNLSTGIHVISAYAFDSEGLNDSESVTITIGNPNASNNVPNVQIISPGNDAVFLDNNYIWFDVEAVDPEDGVLTGSNIRWFSDIDGNFASGTTAWLNNLSVGTHTITVVAMDSQSETGEDSITITINVPNGTNNNPDARIIRPVNNARFENGYDVLFEGRAVDPEDGFLNDVVWFSDRDGFLSNSLIFTRSNLTVGTHEIRFIATDLDGAQDIDSIIVMIENATSGNHAPQIQIVSPANEAVFNEGQLIWFDAQATDPEQGVLTGNAIQWYSSEDGYLGSGTTLWLNDLSNAVHSITAFVTDNKGASGMDMITITVGNVNNTNNTNQTNGTNQAPYVNLTRPFNHAVYNYGDLVLIEGIAIDPEDGALDCSSIDLISSIDGDLKNTNFTQVSCNIIGNVTILGLSDGLSVGVHNITLIGTDSEGSSSSDSAIVTINAVNDTNGTNHAPMINITIPDDNSQFPVNNYILFNAEATDFEDGVITGSRIQWYSSIDGNFGSGTTIWLNDLSEGVHIITATVTDLDGATGQDSITVTIGMNNNNTNNTNQTNQTSDLLVTLTADPTNGIEPLIVSFNCNVENGTAPYVFDYELRDQSMDTVYGGGTYTNSKSYNFSRVLSEGNWTATCNVRDSMNITGFDIATVTVLDNGSNTNNTNNTNQTNQTVYIEILSPVDGNIYSTHYIFVAIDASDYTNVTYEIDNMGEVKYTFPVLEMIGDGNHTITATVSTPYGTATDTASFIVNLQAPEYDSPVVTSISPGDRDLIRQNNIDFRFEASDASGVYSCALIVDGNYVTEKVYQQGMNTISANISGGEHIWQVLCIDNYFNFGWSETRQFTVLGGNNYTLWQPPVDVKVDDNDYRISIRSIRYDDYVYRGDLVPIRVTIENTGDYDLEDLKVSLAAYDLDIQTSSTISKLDKGESIVKTFYIEIPDYVSSGIYDMKVTVSNDEVKQTAYRELMII